MRVGGGGCSWLGWVFFWGAAPAGEPRWGGWRIDPRGLRGAVKRPCACSRRLRGLRGASSAGRPPGPVESCAPQVSPQPRGAPLAPAPRPGRGLAGVQLPPWWAAGSGPCRRADGGPGPAFPRPGPAGFAPVPRLPRACRRVPTCCCPPVRGLGDRVGEGKEPGESLGT